MNNQINTGRHLSRDQRKKILFISDDLRFHSGVGLVSRNIVLGTAHHYNYISIGGAMNHPDKGKRMDLSQSTNEALGIDDSMVHLFPCDGYGNPDLLREIIKHEKPDAIVFITDPRYYEYLFQMEYEIRTGGIDGHSVPLIYIQIWDEAPAAFFNKKYYKSVDMSLCISKQTLLFNKMVLGKDWDLTRLEYFPHGIDHTKFYPIEDPNDEVLKRVRGDLFGGKHYDFVLLYNSRNIRRKSTADIILAFKVLLEKLPEDKRDTCALVMHTQPVDDNGTDLYAVRELLLGDRQNQVIFSNVVGSDQYMNALYNIADATVLISSNEGFGLAGAESIMAGTPVIGNVTGGIQDYARFEDEDGNWFTPSEEIWSNHAKTYTKCGEWFYPVWPSNLSLQGSPITPYIFDSRADYRHVADQMHNVFKTDKETLKSQGNKGREWLMSDEANMTTEKMCESFMSYVDSFLETWEPRHDFEFITIDGPKELNTIQLPKYLQ